MVDQILTRAAHVSGAGPHQQLVRCPRTIRACLNMDETGWRLRGPQRRTLWGAFTDKLAVYRILRANRHEDRARELLALHTGDRDLGSLVGLLTHLPLHSSAGLLVTFASLDFTALGRVRRRESRARRARPPGSAEEVVLGVGDLPAHRRAQRTQAPDPAATPSNSKPISAAYYSRQEKRRYKRYPRASPATCSSAGPPSGLHPQPPTSTDQQPRRTRTTRRHHLPQALPRHPIQGGERNRTAPLRLHHLPTTTTIPLHLPHRRHHRQRPRRPHPRPRLKSQAGTERLQKPRNLQGFFIRGARI